MNTRIEILSPDQWEAFREVRLKALSDTPNAFGSTYEKEIEYSEADWRRMLGRTDCQTFAAFSETERILGIIVGAPYGDDAGLFAMWVDSAERKKGIGRELVDSVIFWAKENEFKKIFLDVADENSAAIRLYESRGFTPTGEKGTLPPPRENITEQQLALELDRSEPVVIANT